MGMEGHQSSPPFVFVGRHDCCFYCFWLPPLEVTSNSLRCSHFVVSELLDEGYSSPQRCALLAGHVNSGIGGRWMLPPPSAAAELAPPPLEVLLHTPPLARRDVLSWVIVTGVHDVPLPLYMALVALRHRGDTMELVACWAEILK